MVMCLSRVGRHLGTQEAAALAACVYGVVGWWGVMHLLEA